MPTIKEVCGGGMMDGGQWKKNAGLFLPTIDAILGGYTLVSGPVSAGELIGGHSALMIVWSV